MLTAAAPTSCSWTFVWPDLDGIEATRAIVGDRELSGVRVVILTTFSLDQYIVEGLGAGAAGFLVKDTQRPRVEPVSERLSSTAPAPGNQLPARHHGCPHTLHSASNPARLVGSRLQNVLRSKKGEIHGSGRGATIRDRMAGAGPAIVARACLLDGQDRVPSPIRPFHDRHLAHS